MRTNLFPAVLLAGPPHSGKSVLSYLLTQHLVTLRIPHYLLRAVPDGEGNWYLHGEQGAVRAIRQVNKGQYSAQFVAHMRSVIERRLVPLLVDVGGKPRGDQFGLISACTHSILLYKTPEELKAWQDMLSPYGLISVAELRSDLAGEEKLNRIRPVLDGVIAGLEREQSLRRAGLTFGALLERVAGIFQYDPPDLEREHLRYAPYPVVTETSLAEKANPEIPATGAPFWKPEELSKIKDHLPSEPWSLYGRGPVWLAAALARMTAPEAMAIFDIRYGWVGLPEVVCGEPEDLRIQTAILDNGWEWAQITLPNGILELNSLCWPEPAPDEAPDRGLVLSGQLPRWAFAALTRHLAERWAWIGIDDPNYNRVVVVSSRSPERQIGEALERPPVMEMLQKG